MARLSLRWTAAVLASLIAFGGCTVAHRLVMRVAREQLIASGTLAPVVAVWLSGSVAAC